MTERERLIELIGSKVCEAYDSNCDEWQPHSCEKCYANDCSIGDLADYLLANGVIVSPCKVGDTVYVISESRVKEAEIDEILRCRYDAKIFVAFECGEDDCASCPFNAWQRSSCGEWDCDNAYGSAELAEDDFGKTVFFTREEAEKELAERSKA